MQPEMTTSAIGGEFRDQLLSFRKIIKYFTKGVKIYVKKIQNKALMHEDHYFFIDSQGLNQFVLYLLMLIQIY